MNKIYRFLLIAGAALMAIGCNKEIAFQEEGMTEVTVGVNLPGVATKAYADGTTASTLNVAVYLHDGIADGRLVTSKTVENAFDVSLQAKVKLNLSVGKQYDFVFWAESLDSPYTFKADEKKVSVNYTCTSAAEKWDAFYGKTTWTAVAGGQVSATLHRPLAQINVGTDDLGVATASYTDIKATIKMNTYGSFGLLDGAPADPTDEAVEFLKAAPMAAADHTSETFPVDGYKYLAMAYVLVEPSETKDITYTVYDGTSIVEGACKTVINAPVKANYRTNIYGTLLTSDVEAVVNIEPVPVGNAANFENGIEIILPDGVTVASMEANNAIAVSGTFSTKAEDGSSDVVYYTDFKSVLAANSASENGLQISLRPGVVIDQSMTGSAHPGTTKSITIYGNGATIQGFDFAVDTYGYEEGHALYGVNSKLKTGDVQDIKIYNLNNIYVWGQGLTDATRNITLVNCHNVGNGATQQAGRMFYLTGTVGATNVTLDGCSVEKSDSPVYSNASGNILLKNCTFTDCAVPVNINYKAATGTQEDVVDGCKFIRCGCTEEMDASISKYAAPMRFVKSDASKDLSATTLNLTIKNTTVENTLGDNGDVLLVELRSGYNYWPVVQKEICDGLRIVDTVPLGEKVKCNGNLYDTIDDALTANTDATEILLGEGSFVYPSKSTSAESLTFVGNSKTQSKITLGKAYYPTDKVINFKNLTQERAYGTQYAEAYMPMLFRAKEENYTDCIISGPARLCVNEKATFNGCTFITTVKSGFDGYNLHYYGYSGTEVIINGCDFHSVSKGIVMYSEGVTTYTLKVSNSSFEATTPDDKCAIQMHTEYGINGTVYINKCTATGFMDKNNCLWQEVNNQTHVDTYKFDIYVDDVKVHSAATE